MKWFKHFSDSLDDPFIFDLIDNYGGDGYLVYFGSIEMISRELGKYSPGTCLFSIRFLAKKLQLSRKKMLKILNFCNEKGKIFIKEDGNDITLNCPKIKELSDNYTQKLLRTDFKQASKQEVEKEVKEEVKKEADSIVIDKKPEPSIDFNLFWSAYPKKNQRVKLKELGIISIKIKYFLIFKFFFQP